MLDALVLNTGRRLPFPIVQGDLTQLPFRTGAFGAALAANVFHLITAWQTAVAELVRVVRPGGLLLVNLGSGAITEQAALISAKFQEVLGQAWRDGVESLGPRDDAEFELCMTGHGASVLPPLEIRFQQTTSLEAAIARIEHNVFARPSDADQDALRQAAATTRAWACQNLGPLDTPLPAERIITYRIYQLG